MKHTKNIGIIYQAYNNISKKSYIGQTIHTLAHRKYYHFYDARRKGKKKNHFQSALLKYDIEDWTWSTVEQNISKKDLDSREIYYIHKFDSYINGYNSTIGGGGLNGSAKSYRLYHEDHGWIEMTMQEFSDTYKLNKGQLNQVILGKTRHIQGWCLSTKQRDKPRKECKKRIMVNPLKSKIGYYKYTIYTIMYKGVKYTGTKVKLAKILNVSVERIRQISMINDCGEDVKTCLISSLLVEKYYLLKPFRKKKISYSEHYKDL